MQVAARDHHGAERVAKLLEGVAEVASEKRSSASLSENEQAMWTRLGASFDDRGAVDRDRIRAISAFDELLRGSVRGDHAVAELLGVSSSRVSQRVSERSLYVIVAEDDRHFPRWQFDGARTIPGLKEVLLALDLTLHPLTVAHWFTTPSSELLADDTRLSPRDWLATDGDVHHLVELAADL